MTEPAWFDDLLRIYARIAIAGGPKSGKTALSGFVRDRPVIHTDDFIPLGWSEASEATVQRCNAMPSCYVVEGVAVPRALRKGLLVDCVVYLTFAHDRLTSKQTDMAKGCETVFQQWRDAHPHAIVVVR